MHCRGVARHPDAIVESSDRVSRKNAATRLPLAACSHIRPRRRNHDAPFHDTRIIRDREIHKMPFAQRSQEQRCSLRNYEELLNSFSAVYK